MKTRISQVFGSLVLFTAGLAISSPTVAHALSLSAVGAITQGTTSTSDALGDSTKGTLGYGGGLLLDTRLMPGLGFETGGIYLVNRLNVTLLGATTTSSLDSVYIPIDLRIRLMGPLSATAGGFYNAFTQSGVSSDYGWEAGLRLSFWHWFVDARYSHGLKDQGGFEYSNVMGLLGIRL